MLWLASSVNFASHSGHELTGAGGRLEADGSVSFKRLGLLENRLNRFLRGPVGSRLGEPVC